MLKPLQNKGKIAAPTNALKCPPDELPYGTATACKRQVHRGSSKFHRRNRPAPWRHQGEMVPARGLNSSAKMVSRELFAKLHRRTGEGSTNCVQVPANPVRNSAMNNVLKMLLEGES